MSKLSLYLNAFRNVVNARMEDETNRRYLKQNALYGVRLINSLPKPLEYEEIRNRFDLVCAIKAVMSELTPAELMNVFPITKEYDGHKYEMKDYFYTIEYMKRLDQSKPIGEKISKTLWEYMNDDLRKFQITLLGLMSDLRRYEGKPSLAEEWAVKNDIEFYVKHTDPAGKEYLLDSKGRTQRVMKPRPKHLRLVN